MVRLNSPFDYKLKNKTYTYTNTYTVSKNWYKANAQYLMLQARDTMAQVYNKANISNDRVIDFFNLKVGDVLSVKKILFWKKLYINGSIAKNLRFDSVLSFSAKDIEKRNIIFDSISYKLYDLSLKKPVLGMKYLNVVTDGNNSILGVIAQGDKYIDVNAIIRVIEMKTGKKFSFLDNRADDKVEAFLKRHNSYYYFSWFGRGGSEDFSDACPPVIRESVSTEDTNIYIISERFDGYGQYMLWIGDPNFYEILQESERKEREKRVKESLYIKIENVDGL